MKRSLKTIKQMDKDQRKQISMVKMRSQKLLKINTPNDHQASRSTIKINIFSPMNQSVSTKVQSRSNIVSPNSSVNYKYKKPELPPKSKVFEANHDLHRKYVKRPNSELQQVKIQDYSSHMRSLVTNARKKLKIKIKKVNENDDDEIKPLANFIREYSE